MTAEAEVDTSVNLMLSAELYANCAGDEGEIYANDVRPESTTTNGGAGTVHGVNDGGEMEKEYLNIVTKGTVDRVHDDEDELEEDYLSPVTEGVPGMVDKDDQGEMDEEYLNIVVTKGVTGTVNRVDDDEDDMEEEYQNVIETNRPTEEQRPPPNDDRHPIYQNFSRKPKPAPKPAPKPKRRF